MNFPYSMRSRTAELPASRNNRVSFGSFLLMAAISCALLFSSCASSGPLLFASTVPDSLVEASTRELVAASLQSAKGEYRGAIERYRKLLTTQPSNAAIHYALSKAWVGLGLLDSARLYSEKSVSLNPRNKYYAGFLAALSHQQHDYGRATELYRQLAASEPGSTEPLTNLALEYLAAEQPEKALAVFQQILALDPKNEDTLVQMLLMEIKLTHYQDAINTMTELIEQSDEKEKLRLTLGELYLQTKQYTLASKTFKELLKESPGTIPAWLALFEVSVHSANPSAFLDDLNLFFNTNQVSLQQKIELAKLFLMRSTREYNFVDPAFVMIGEINKRHPGNGQIYALRGMAQLQKQDVAAAVIDFRKALLLDSGNVDIWEELIAALLIQKEFRQAGETLLKAKKRFPVMTFRLQVEEGELLFQTGKIKQAALLLEKVLAPKSAQKEKRLYLQASSTLAFCYDRLALRDKSILLYKRILDFDPDNILMMNNLAYVLAAEGKELPRAKELALKVVEAEPANAGYLDTLGWVLFRMEEYEYARSILEKAAGLDPLEAEIAEHLGQVYEKLGNLEKAFEMKKKVRKLKAK
jgi:tetratricopeptide (TPR) repeat protein